MALQRTRKVPALMVWSAVILLLAGFSVACKGKKAAPAAAETPDTISSLRSILGEAKEDYPGVQDIEQAGKEFTVYYRFVPKDTNTLQEELGDDLAPKIRKIYDTDKVVDVLRFVVLIPFTEEAGGGGFKRQLSFAMTRKIFVETDWTGLLSQEFLKVVEDLKAID